NALIIVALIPLALRGVRYRAVGGSVLLRDNLLIYGLGGLVAPLLGIKLLARGLVARGLVCPEVSSHVAAAQTRGRPARPPDGTHGGLLPAARHPGRPDRLSAAGPWGFCAPRGRGR